MFRTELFYIPVPVPGMYICIYIHVHTYTQYPYAPTCPTLARERWTGCEEEERRPAAALAVCGRPTVPGPGSSDIRWEHVPVLNSAWRHPFIKQTMRGGRAPLCAVLYEKRGQHKSVFFFYFFPCFFSGACSLVAGKVGCVFFFHKYHCNDLNF